MTTNNTAGKTWIKTAGKGSTYYLKGTNLFLTKKHDLWYVINLDKGDTFEQRMVVPGYYTKAGAIKEFDDLIRPTL